MDLTDCFSTIVSLLQQNDLKYIDALKQNYQQFSSEQVHEFFVVLYDRAKQLDRTLAKRYRTGEDCLDASQAEEEFRLLRNWYRTNPIVTDLGHYIYKLINFRLWHLRPRKEALRQSISVDELIAYQLQHESTQ